MMSRSWAERPISCALCLWTEIAPGRFGRPEVPAPCLSWRMPRALMRTSVSMCCSRFFFVFGSDEQLDLMCPIPQHLQHSRYAGSAGQLLTAVARHSARSSVPRVPHKLPRSRRSRGPSGMHTLLSHLRGSLIPPHTRAPLRNRSGEVGRFLAPSWRYLHLLHCSTMGHIMHHIMRYLHIIGSTPQNGADRTPFFDKPAECGT